MDQWNNTGEVLVRGRERKRERKKLGEGREKIDPFLGTEKLM